MSLTFEDVETLLRVFRASEYSEICIEVGDFKFAASKNGNSVTRLTSSEPAAAAPRLEQLHTPDRAQAVVEPGTIAVRAEVAGQFYRSPSPGAEPFCTPGSVVNADTVVCLVEIMKLFTSVRAGVSGTVTRILVENGSAVEPGQPLILIRPDKT